MLSLLTPSVFSAEKETAWQKLAPIPDKVGFAAPFAGVHHGALIVAGGANFPDKLPWQGGTKVWHERVFVLADPKGDWIEVGQLPRKCGYGVSISTEDGVVCIGGSDASKHSDEVLLIQWVDGKVKYKDLPRLPQPCANACGALLNGVIYIAGGLGAPDDTATLKTFWALDLNEQNPAWKVLASWNGAARMLATAGVLNGEFLLMGGCDLTQGNDGKAERIWLKDAYAYRPGKGWRNLADMPRAAVAAPSPATVLTDNQLLILGGDDGCQLGVNPDQHPGFPKLPLLYDTGTDEWQVAASREIPFSLVTTSMVIWNNLQVIPGGEARPGVRSTEVWAAPLPKSEPSTISTP